MTAIAGAGHPSTALSLALCHDGAHVQPDAMDPDYPTTRPRTGWSCRRSRRCQWCTAAAIKLGVMIGKGRGEPAPG